EGARPRQPDLDHTIDPSRARRHHQDAIGKKDSFRHAMRDEKHAHEALAADLLQIQNQLVAGERIERPERLVHQELIGFMKGRATSLPSMLTVPPDAGSSPAVIMSRVLLPQPLGPTTQRNSPRRARSDTWSRARTGPSRAR